MSTQNTRRKQCETMRMPDTLHTWHVCHIMQWPLGKVMTAKAAGENWTDVLIELIEPIRLGGRHNTRRVRYDGRFYITYNKRVVVCVAPLALDILDEVGHVYGRDAASDAAHNVKLKGY